MTDWEAGKVETPPSARISAALEFPESFFFLDDLEEVAADSVSFRALTAMTRRQSHRVLANAAMIKEFGLWIDRHYKTPDVDVPSVDELIAPQNQDEPSPVDAAAALRTMWQLGARPIKNMLTLLERRGVYVFGLADDDREVDAFSFWQDDRAYIFVNFSKSGERIRFDLAHELGHLCMHRGVPTARNRNFELAANNFASAFLIPLAGLLPQLTGTPTLPDVLELKKYWRVSAVAMVRRLHQLGRLSDWQYRQWMIDFTQRGFRSREPDGIQPEQSSLLRQVLTYAREDGWSVRRIADETGVPASDLRTALMGLTITSVPSAASVAGDSRGDVSTTPPRLRSV